MREVNFIVKKFTNNYGCSVIEMEHGGEVYEKWALLEQQDNLQITIFSQNFSKAIEGLGSCTESLRRRFNSSKLKVVLILFSTENDMKNAKEHFSTPIECAEGTQCAIIMLRPESGEMLLVGEGARETALRLRSIYEKRQGITRNHYLPLVTYLIIAANLLMYLITSYYSGAFLNANIYVLIALGAKVNPLIAAGQYYRLVSYMFLHGGLLHLALNMYALYNIGPMMERLYGKIRFTALYFVSGILSGVLGLMFSKGISVGASGAIFGLMGAMLAYGVKYRAIIGREFYRNIVSVIMVNLIIGLSLPNIDNIGHIGGLLGGILMSFILTPHHEGM